MKRVAVVTDSNSGIAQNQAKDMGIHVVPMPFCINGETFYEDINLTQSEFYEKLKEGQDISTSMPSVGDVIDLWDGLLKEYDEIVHIPMSSGLSGSCEAAMMLSKDYHGKVQVVNNHRISITQKQSVLDAMTLAEAGKTAEEIKKKLEEMQYDASIYIMLETLFYLKKGGRITPAAAALGTLLKIKPVLQLQGEKLDAFAKARTVKQGKGIMLDAIKSDLEKRFNDPNGENTWIQMAYSGENSRAMEWKEEISKVFPHHEICVEPLSLSVSCHIGPGALAIACTKKMIF